LRLDQFLAGNPDILSRSEAQRLIRSGRVTVRGKVERKVSRDVGSSDGVEYSLFPLASVPQATDATIELKILYEDSDCFVVDKPAGISVHPGNGMEKGSVTILDALRPLFAERKLPFSESDVLVHRLDKETTGCLLIAKNAAAHTSLQKQFASRTVQKTYLACVSGVPIPAAAVIDAPIGRHTGDRTKMSIIQTGKTRGARTTYRTLSAASGMALLACDLHTGRTHQIRVHLRSIGHPVLGDQKYHTTHSLNTAAQYSIENLCLHAWQLSFDAAAKRVHVEAPLSLALQRVLERLGIHFP
jgi:23S rRNA pseudouridine1911/1915/1917 synthase